MAVTTLRDYCHCRRSLRPKLIKFFTGQNSLSAHPSRVPRVKRILWEIAGWLFIVLGIAGLFLPVLQGILFLLIGLTILSKQYHWARHWIVKLRRKFPEAHRKVHRMLGRHSKHITRADSSAADD